MSALSVVLPPARPRRRTPPFFGVSAAALAALSSIVEIVSARGAEHDGAPDELAP